MKSLGNSNDVEPENRPVEQLKIGLHHDLTVPGEFHHDIASKVAQRGHQGPPQKQDRVDCGINRDIFLAIYAGTVPLKIVAKRLGKTARVPLSLST